MCSSDLYCKCNEELSKCKTNDIEIMNTRFNEIYNTYYYAEMPNDILDEYFELYPYARYYNLIKNIQYFDNICNLEKEMTEYDLCNHEKEVVNIIKEYFNDYIFETSELYEL